MLNSQIQSQKSSDSEQHHTNKKKTGSQEGETGQGNQEMQQHPERGRQDTTAQQSYLIHVPSFLSLVRRNSYTIPSYLLRTRHVFFDPFSLTIAKLLTTVLLLLDMFPVAAGIAERVGGAASLLKVIVSSFLDFFECNVVFIFIFCLVTHIRLREIAEVCCRLARKDGRRGSFEVQGARGQLAQICGTKRAVRLEVPNSSERGAKSDGQALRKDVCAAQYFRIVANTTREWAMSIKANTAVGVDRFHPITPMPSSVALSEPIVFAQLKWQELLLLDVLCYP